METTASWTYFIILGLSVLYPLAQSFEKRVYMYRKMKFIFPGIFFSGTLFIIWDVFFTRHEIWGFNHNYTRDFYLLGLPIEEWLFFLIVPYCIFFMYEVLRWAVKKFYFPLFARIATWVLLIGNLAALPLVWGKTYTFTAMAFVVPFLALMLWMKTWKTWFSGFLLTYLVSFIPFTIVNGFLTRIPVVWYNNAENLSMRFTTIPVEDFVYLLGMLLPAFMVYHALLNRYGSDALKEKMRLDEPTGF